MWLWWLLLVLNVGFAGWNWYDFRRWLKLLRRVEEAQRASEQSLFQARQLRGDAIQAMAETRKMLDAMTYVSRSPS